jgi:hypothetical protein
MRRSLLIRAEATVVDTQDRELVAAEVVDLVVLAAPVPCGPERAAARFGELVEAPVVITQGAQLPLAGLLLAPDSRGRGGVWCSVRPGNRVDRFRSRCPLSPGPFMVLVIRRVVSLVSPLGDLRLGGVAQPQDGGRFSWDASQNAF